MMGSSVFKRAYDGLALFAILNAVVLGAMAAYLVASGAVDAVKVQRIAAVLRGEDRPEEHPAPVAEAGEAAGANGAAEPLGEQVAADTSLELEIIRREADRLKEELRQQLALNNSILLRITTERENFRREREAAAEQTAAERRERDKEGFDKQLAILEGVKADTAVTHLLALGDVDEAARILLAMEVRKAKKIVEAAKRPDQLEQMKIILRRLRDVSPGRSAQLWSEG